MPRSFFWDDWTNTQDEKHILNLLEDWTTLQHRTYRGLAWMAEGLLQGGETLSKKAGHGPFKVLPGIITVRSSFMLRFCSHAPQSCVRDRWDLELPTCHCNLFCLVAKSSKEELKAINRKLRAVEE